MKKVFTDELCNANVYQLVDKILVDEQNCIQFTLPLIEIGAFLMEGRP